MTKMLDWIIEWRGEPVSFRCDNGPAKISGALMNWAKHFGIVIHHVQPGKLQQNAYIENYNGTVRYDWIAQFILLATARFRTSKPTGCGCTTGKSRTWPWAGHPDNEHRYGHLMSSTCGVT